MSDSKDLSANHTSDSTQDIRKNIILAQNENPNANQNPNTTDSSDSNAESTPKVAQVYDLGRIERTVKTEIDANSSTTQITAEDFDNTASSNVAEALRLTPGVYYGAPNGSKAGTDISIRGYGGDRVGIEWGFLSMGFPRIQSMIDTQTTAFSTPMA